METRIVKYMFGYRLISGLKSVKYNNYIKDMEKFKKLFADVIHKLKISFIEITYAMLIYIHHYRLLRINAGRKTITYYNALCVSLMLSNKLLNDRPYKNMAWSTYLNRPLKVINMIELKFLLEVNFEVIPPYTQFRKIWFELFSEV